MAQLTYKAMKDNAALKNLPILTLDQRWYRLVPESVKTDEIRYWEKRVNELLKKQGQVNEDLIQVKKIRKGLFRGIVNHMNQNDEDPKKQKIMDESQRLIYEARDKISQLEDESDEVPKKLRIANMHLFYETVKMCYEKINRNNKDLERLEAWIEDTRISVPEVPVPAEVPVPVEVLLPAPARSALAPALVTTFWFTFAVTSLI